MSASHSIGMNYYSIYAAGQPPRKASTPRAAAAVALLVATAALALLLTTGVFRSGAREAAPALYVTAGDVEDFGRDVVEQHARNVRWVGRQLRGAWRESVGAVAAVGREVHGAARTVARAVDDAIPPVAKKPLVAVPLAVGAGAYAVAQEWPQQAVDVAVDGAALGAKVVLDVADFATDRMREGIDFFAAHPKATGAAVAAVTVPMILEAAGIIDAGDDLQAATDKVAAAAGRAARRVDDQLHDAGHKAQ